MTEDRPSRDLLEDADWLRTQLETMTPAGVARLMFAPPGAVRRAMRRLDVVEPDRDLYPVDEEPFGS